MSVEQVNQLLATGSINAYEYYNFFKQRNDNNDKHRATRTIDTTNQKCSRTHNTENCGILSSYTSHLNAGSSKKYSSQRTNFSKHVINGKCHPATEFNRKAVKCENLELCIGESNGLLTLSSKPRVNRSPIITNTLGRLSNRHQFSVRIKPSDMRYCSDKNRESLVNKIIQEEKIKQIRRSLANYELYRGYREGFDSGDEKTIDEEIEHSMPSIHSISSSTYNSSDNELQTSTVSLSDTQSGLMSTSMTSQCSEKSSSLSSQSTDSSTFYADNLQHKLPVSSYKIFILKLSMIEEDADKISKHLSQARQDMVILHNKFASSNTKLLRWETSIESVYKLLTSFAHNINWEKSE